MLTLEFGFDAPSRKLSILTEYDRDIGLIGGTRGDKDALTLHFTMTDPNSLLENASISCAFGVEVQLPNNKRRVFMPELQLSNNSVVVPDYIMAAAAKEVLPIQLHIRGGSSPNSPDYFSENIIEIRIFPAIDVESGISYSPAPIDVSGAFTNVGYTENNQTITFTAADGSSRAVVLNVTGHAEAHFIVDDASELTGEKTNGAVSGDTATDNDGHWWFLYGTDEQPHATAANWHEIGHILKVDTLISNVSTLTAGLATEVSDRTTADETLQDAIDAEAAARVAADNTKQNKLTVTGDLSLQGNTLSYTMPAATVNSLGGIIVGANLAITNGVLSATAQLKFDGPYNSVSDLPQTGETNTIYLVSDSEPPSDKNTYDEYIYVRDISSAESHHYELIGTTRISLSITKNSNGVYINNEPIPMADEDGPGLMSSAHYQYIQAGPPIASSTVVGALRTGNISQTGVEIVAPGDLTPPSVQSGGLMAPLMTTTASAATDRNILRANVVDICNTSGTSILNNHKAYLSTISSTGRVSDAVDWSSQVDTIKSEVVTGLYTNKLRFFWNTWGSYPTRRKECVIDIRTSQATHDVDLMEIIPYAGSNIPGIVAIDTSKIYMDQFGQITIPNASGVQPGVIKVGSGLAIDTNGVLSSTYSLPTASTSTLGGVKVDGTTITIDAQGVISSSGGGGGSIPIATRYRLGGIKVGGGLAITAEGVLSATNTGQYVEKVSTQSILYGNNDQGVQTSYPIGHNTGYIVQRESSGIWVTNGTQSATDTEYAATIGYVNDHLINQHASYSDFGTVKIYSTGQGVPEGLVVDDGVLKLGVATSTCIGGIQIGTGLTMSGQIASIATASSETFGGVKIDGVTIKLNSDNKIYAVSTSSPHTFWFNGIGYNGSEDKGGSASNYINLVKDDISYATGASSENWNYISSVSVDPYVNSDKQSLVLVERAKGCLTDQYVNQTYYEGPNSGTYSKHPLLLSAYNGELYPVDDPSHRTSTANDAALWSKDVYVGSDGKLMHYYSDTSIGSSEFVDTHYLDTHAVPKATTVGNAQVGSVTNPIYLTSGGVPTPCTYELNKTVPSDAIFTDHIYAAGTGLLSSTDQETGVTTFRLDPDVADTKVTQTVSDSAEGQFPVLLGPDNVMVTTKTDSVRYDSQIRVSPTSNTLTLSYANGDTNHTISLNASNGTVTADKFTGTASSATTAAKVANALKLYKWNGTVQEEITFDGSKSYTIAKIHAARVADIASEAVRASADSSGNVIVTYYQQKLRAGANITITDGNLISAAVGLTLKVVAQLPQTGVENTIYLVPKQDSPQGDVYDEYIWVNSAWERIGSTAVDLSNYYTKAETNGLLSGKANSSHTHDWEDITDTPTTLAGYGISDAHIDTSTRVITLGSNIIEVLSTSSELNASNLTTGTVPPERYINTTYTFATGSANGTISVAPSGGSASDVAVKGLGSAAYTDSTAYATASDFTAHTSMINPHQVTMEQIGFRFTAISVTEEG